jgi:hypothetical protein
MLTAMMAACSPPAPSGALPAGVNVRPIDDIVSQPLEITNFANDGFDYYRVQGIDASGVLYISEVMTFETPPRVARDVENLASAALGAEVIGYSSAFGDAAPEATWGVGSAFDDNPNTAWSSAGDGDGAWVEVQLARRAHVEAVSFRSRSMSDGSAITRSFTVTTESGEVFGPFDLPDADQPHRFDLALEAQSLRFDFVDTTGGNTGAVDIAVFGEFVE